MKYIIILLFALSGNAYAQPGFFEGLFGKQNQLEELEQVPDNNTVEKKQSGKYWQAWLEEYRCNIIQFELVERETEICVKGDYKKEYCFANAKRLYCDKYEHEYE